jgi:hypothetical protein
MPKNERLPSSGAGTVAPCHHFTIRRSGDRWVASYDSYAPAEGETRMEAVRKLNAQLAAKPAL